MARFIPVSSISQPKYWSRKSRGKRLTPQFCVHLGNAPSDGLYHIDCHTVACLFVGLVIALDGKHRVDAVICPALQAQTALNATGRHPNVQGLGLETIGVTPDKKGAIPVDADSRTTASGVWAIGDVTNRVNLTPVAIAEGRAFADTEFGGRPMQVSHHNIASAVFCSPPIASVGLTEAQAAEKGPTDVYTSQFRPMKKAFVGSNERTFMKLLVDRTTDRVVGIHMLGADAPEIIQGLAISISAGATKRHFDSTMALHPTSSEEFVLMREPVRKHG